METDFSFISELQNIREQKHRLSEREAELTMPLLTDLTLIPEIYRWFSEILSEMPLPPYLQSVTQRKKFIFIILSLYSPSTLAGGKMLIGLRDKISEATGVYSKSVISDNCADIAFEYKNYKPFRADIDHIYTEIIERLRNNELIK